MEQGYQTQNLALATTLATCGVPFYEADGKLCPVLNIYSPEIIRAMRDQHGLPRYKGWQLEKAVRHAWENGREGRVVFCFQRTPELEQIVSAYNAQRAAIEKEEPSTEPLNIDPAEAARLACQFSHNRKFLRDAWKHPVPLIFITSGVSTVKGENERSTTTGSAKIMSLNASKETRAKLKL